MSRPARLLGLLQALRGRRHPVTAARLAKLLEVSERTIYRDVAALMAQGAPISGEAGVGYVLRPGLFLPPLMLSDDEVEAVMLGLRYVDQRGDATLRAAAAEALAKIGAVLSPQAQATLTAPTTMPGPPPTFPDNATPLDGLRAAIRAQTRLDISYEDDQRRRTQRVVWPIQLGFMDRARVLAAWCELRQDFRTFRTDRIVLLAPLDRYPGRRADLTRRLRAHLDASQANYTTPDGNWQEASVLLRAHQLRRSFEMPANIIDNLPRVIADHIDACNAHDIEAWMATFAPVALVNDFQREFDGAAAIRAFGEKEIFGAEVTMAPVRAAERYGDVSVDARMDGTYDKTGLPDPLILSFYFTIRDGRITQLIIIHNKA